MPFRPLANYLVPAASSIRDAVQAIDLGSAQIALVVAADKRLLGTVTDGDVRRALLRGQGLDTPVTDIMNRHFRCLPSGSSAAAALAMMRREAVHQLPVIDAQGRVVDLFILDELLKQPPAWPNTVVIMAGGRGQRLQPLTYDCPKPMLPVGGKPMLQIVLEQCSAAGFTTFYVAVNYLKQQIQDYFGDGSRWKVMIRYLEETQALGTAGALSLLPETPHHPLLVMNGDVLTRVDFTRLLRFHQEQQSAATLCVREYATQIPYGVVRMEDMQVVELQEKPVLNHYVNAGIYVLNPELLELLPQPIHAYDMPQLLDAALTTGRRVTAFPIHEYWLDVGHREALEQANGEWL